MRKLVSIQKIRSVESIPEADKIEVVRVLGWAVVVKKDEFKVGDKVVYAEIDSLFPHKPEFEFLKNNNYRIRTIRLRGQISQGICFPLSILPDGEYEEGQDVTELLGVKKYEPPIPMCLHGVMKGKFPVFLKKTDETRVQILQDMLDKYKGIECYISEKLEGSSSTFYLHNGDFGCCTKDLDILESEENALWIIARKNNIEEKLKKLNMGNIAIQGEIIGESIQENIYGFDRNDRRLYIYKVFDIDNYRYYDYEEVIEIAKKLDIPTVPILDDNFILIDDIDQLVELSKGNSVINPKTKREGIVITAKRDPGDIKYQRISFKVINPEYLIKHKL